MANLVLFNGKEPVTSAQTCIALRTGENKRKTAETPVSELIMIITHCAKTHCGAVDIDILIFGECATFVQSHFPNLDYREIDLAFSMASAQVFECDMTTWYKQFSVSILGRILNGYIQYAQKIVQEYKKNNPVPEIERTKSEVDLLIEKSLQAEKERFYEIAEYVRNGKDLTEAHELAMKYQASFLSENGFFDQFGLDRRNVARDSFEQTKRYYEKEALSTNKEVRYKARVMLKDITDGNMPKNESEFWREHRANYSKMLYLQAVQQFNAK